LLMVKSGQLSSESDWGRRTFALPVDGKEFSLDIGAAISYE
jgi:hypothetical protein